MTMLFAATMVAVSVSFVLTPLTRRVLLKFGILDVPNDRSLHEQPIPRGGGASVLLAVVVGCLVGNVLDETWLRWALGMALLVGILGLVDDVRPLDARVRLLLQCLAAVFLAYVVGLEMRVLGLPGLGLFELGIVAWPVTAFWLVGYTNSFNFMDGINGIAAMHAVVAGVFLALLGIVAGDYSVTVISMCIAGSALGFLPWNFPRASVFMGDVGSAFYGFLLASVVVRLERLGIPIAAAMLPLFPFLFDTTITLVRRAFKGERLLSAHRSHLYQRITVRGWSHTKVTVLWSLLALMSGVSALGYALQGEGARIAILLVVTLVHAALAAWVLSRRAI